MKTFLTYIALITITVCSYANTHISVIQPLDGEKWWGGITSDGYLQPYEDLGEFDLSKESRLCATAPFLVSDKGRYVWSDKPFRFSFSDGVLTIKSEYEKVLPVQAGKTLKEAYLEASSKHFPFTGQTPPEEMFTKPQFNNWIEVAVFGVTQQVSEEYIDAIADNGFPCGVLMLDGGWMIQHGSMKFNPETFPDPERLFEKIRSYGYKGMLWASNFISPDNRREYLDYRLSWPRKKPLLLESNEYPGEECIVHWWSGKSVTFDFTNPEALKEFADNLEKFRKEYGFDGFKFDGGDPEFFRGKAKFHKPDARECDFSHAYNQLGLHFPFHEFRIGYKTGGMPIIIRLQDIPHTWKGLEKVLYNAQTAGLMGCPYIIGDMIGGGLSSSYSPGKPFSHKLFIRSCQIQALMPMMQFSAAPWRVLTSEECDICRRFAQLHSDFGEYIMEQVRHAAETGEPIVRTMEYEFPGQGFNRRMPQYMFGPDYLVAPVINEDDSIRIELPAGDWLDDLGETHHGPKVIELKEVPLDRLPYFRRQSTNPDIQ